MVNQKVIIKETGKFGKGLFAIEDIKKGEIIADWTNGKVYETESANQLPNQLPEYVHMKEAVLEI